MNSKDSVVTIMGVLILFISLAGAFVSGAPEETVSAAKGFDPTGKVRLTGDLKMITGYGEENSEASHSVTVDQDLIESVKFTLTWSDEPNQGPRYTNGPDTMSLEVGAPDGSILTAGPEVSDYNDPAKRGASLTVEFSYAEPRGFDDDTWVVTVKVGECGDQELILSPLNIRDDADTGNPYAVKGEVSYWAKEESSGSGGQTGGGAGVDMMGPTSPWDAPYYMPGARVHPVAPQFHRTGTAGVAE